MSVSPNILSKFPNSGNVENGRAPNNPSVISIFGNFGWSEKSVSTGISVADSYKMNMLIVILASAFFVKH